MTNKNIIISLVDLAAIVGGIFLIFKVRAVSVIDTNAMIADRGGLTEFQTDINFPKNTADVTNDGTSLRAFSRASYKATP